jgi:hypothetical protein
MKYKVGLQINFRHLARFRYIIFIFILILIQNFNCTQTDYFGVFDVDSTMVDIYFNKYLKSYLKIKQTSELILAQ